MKQDITLSLSFLAGLLSFFSPCVLPLIPSYISFITGLSLKELTTFSNKKKTQLTIIAHSIAFILGFSIIFIGLGISTSIIGNLLFVYQDYLRIIGGFLVIIFGLFIAGIVRLDFLMGIKKLNIEKKPVGYLGSFIVGIAFSAGWSPCIGPILGTILIYASTQGSSLYGFKLLTAYSLGLAIPFFLSSIGINIFLVHSKRIFKHMRLITLISGIILIIFGILLLTDKVRVISTLFPTISF
jgi:cytochrome c-type biogenesis protein